MTSSTQARAKAVTARSRNASCMSITDAVLVGSTGGKRTID
jgi:hypothetical protein